MLPRRDRTVGKHLLLDILSYITSRKHQEHDYIETFRQKLCSRPGLKHAVFTSSGRAAMGLIIDFFSLPPGSEILMPAYTLKDLAVLIRKMGFEPVFVDVDPSTYNLDAGLLEEKITEKTRMVIATHMFGMPCEIDRITRICRNRGVVLIEDCAHSLGASYKDRSVGTFGEAGFFSLEVTKPVNTFGGGILVTDNDELAEYATRRGENLEVPRGPLAKKIVTTGVEDAVIQSPLYSLLGWLFYFGSVKKIITDLVFHFHAGVSIKGTSYSNLQAFLGSRQIEILEERNASLMEKGDYFRSLLSDSIDVPRPLDDSIPAFYFNVVKIGGRPEEARKQCLKKGIDIGIRDEITDHCPRFFGLTESFPHTDSCFDHTIQLPMGKNMDRKTLERLASIVNRL